MYLKLWGRQPLRLASRLRKGLTHANQGPHIWVARFKSKEALDEYMAEAIDEDDEDAPISRFAADQGVGFYDHDLVYAEFLKDATPRALIACWGFPDTATEAVVTAVQAWAWMA